MHTDPQMLAQLQRTCGRERPSSANDGTTRRRFLQSAAALASGLASIPCFAGEQPAAAPVVVGGCAWVYSIEQPNHDIEPILDQVFADMAYAGMEGVEIQG